MKRHMGRLMIKNKSALHKLGEELPPNAVSGERQGAPRNSLCTPDRGTQLTEDAWLPFNVR